MTKDELKKTMRRELRQNGFRVFGSFWVRTATDEVADVAQFYLHRFRPQLLVDLGVLLRERWPDPACDKVRSWGGWIHWDMSARLDSTLLVEGSDLNFDRASAFDLDVPVDDDVRARLVGESVVEATRLFYGRFRSRSDLLETAKVRRSDNELRITRGLYEHFGLTEPER